MAVFLLGSLFLFPFFHPSFTGLETEKGILGQTAYSLPVHAALFATASAASDGLVLSTPSFPEAVLESGPLPAAFGADAVSSQNDQGNLLNYRVAKGDTLSGIAKHFNISTQTILNANPTLKGKSLKIGMMLILLPTSGSVYVTKDGDTLESLSAYFNISQDGIRQFNTSIDFNTLGPGISLVIPGVRVAAQMSTTLPNLNSEFIMPTQGFNWGQLHHYNAVDISNSCGEPVVASAEGLVMPDESYGDGRDGWNGGYGSFVLIEHPFGDSVRTRYAHLSKILVSIGDYVKQGQEIGLVGQTGDASGCHVHFEVYSAQNPFVK